MGMGGMGGAQMGVQAGVASMNAYQSNRAAYEETKFNKRIAEYNAQLARNRATEERDLLTHNGRLRRRDAALARINAAVATGSAETAEMDVRRDVSRFRSSVRAGAGAAGVLVDTGSALEQDLEAARLGEYHALKAGFSHRMAAYAHEEDAKLFENEATYHEDRAKYMTEHGIEAAGALLQLSSDYYGKWAKYYNNTLVQVGTNILSTLAAAAGTSYDMPKPSSMPQTGDMTFDPEQRFQQEDFKEQRAGEREDYSGYDYTPSGSMRRQGAGEAEASESFVITGGGIRDSGAYF